jgi:sigma-B regulation protein RsbU (phosphoserine phosphatase)
MPHKILIVDDEPDLEYLIRQKFRKKIRDKEYELISALNGQEALRLLQNDRSINLILTDINMPQMDGLTLLKKIRELNNPLLKTIIISAYGDMENIRTAMNRGAFDFITKPINFEDLQVTITKTLTEIASLKSALDTHDHFVALQQELQIARNIQTSILPKNALNGYNGKRFELDAFIETAAEVGGDFYDFFMIDDRRLGFVIGDVSGKGIPAAIFMAVSKTAIKTTAMRNLPANECLNTINNVLTHESVSDMYVTGIYGILDIFNGDLELCNAGHNYPYLLGQNGDIKKLTESGGIPLGYLENFDYLKYNFKLQPGETLFFYTDGVPEAMNNVSSEFSEMRLEASLKAHKSNSVNKLLQGVVSDVKQFTNGIIQSDDITMLALRLSLITELFHILAKFTLSERNAYHHHLFYNHLFLYRAGR